jgi:hypothetical protein
MRHRGLRVRAAADLSLTVKDRAAGFGGFDPRRLRRAAFLVGVIGSVLVLVAIPTNSALIVGIGASLIVVAHILFFLRDFAWPRRQRELDSSRGEDPGRDQRFRSDWS